MIVFSTYIIANSNLFPLSLQSTYYFENHINRFPSSNTSLQTAILPSGRAILGRGYHSNQLVTKITSFCFTFALSHFFYLTRFLFPPASSRLSPTLYLSIFIFIIFPFSTEIFLILPLFRFFISYVKEPWLFEMPRSLKGFTPPRISSSLP